MSLLLALRGGGLRGTSSIATATRALSTSLCSRNFSSSSVEASTANNRGENQVDLSNLCFVCGKRGHAPSECALKPPDSPIQIGANWQNLSCVRCLLPGHRLVDCTEKPHPDANILCRWCGQPGHMYRDCPTGKPVKNAAAVVQPTKLRTRKVLARVRQAVEVADEDPDSAWESSGHGGDVTDRSDGGDDVTVGAAGGDGSEVDGDVSTAREDAVTEVLDVTDSKHND